MKKPRLPLAINWTVLFLALCLALEGRAGDIMVIGDSHTCGDFGKKLAKNLAENGKFKVTVYCAGGLSAQHWIRGFTPPRPANYCKTYSSENSNMQNCFGSGDIPALEKILSTSPRPHRIIVALGSNNLGLNGLSSFRAFSERIKKEGLSCQWVGPPTLGSNGEICRRYGANLVRVVTEIQRATQDVCDFVDSRNVATAEATPDCIHRYGKAAYDWADGVFRALNSKL
jgi:hypothetical protein